MKNLTWQNPEQLFVAQELINKVKSKCCGIKVHFYNDIDVWELYDLQADPTEMHNLYGQKEYEPVVTELKTELARLQEQYNDPVRFSPDRDKE